MTLGLTHVVSLSGSMHLCAGVYKMSTGVYITKANAMAGGILKDCLNQSMSFCPFSLYSHEQEQPDLVQTPSSNVVKDLLKVADHIFYVKI